MSWLIADLLTSLRTAGLLAAGLVASAGRPAWVAAPAGPAGRKSARTVSTAAASVVVRAIATPRIT